MKIVTAGQYLPADHELRLEFLKLEIFNSNLKTANFVQSRPSVLQCIQR